MASASFVWAKPGSFFAAEVMLAAVQCFQRFLRSSTPDSNLALFCVGQISPAVWPFSSPSPPERPAVTLVAGGLDLLALGLASAEMWLRRLAPGGGFNGSSQPEEDVTWISFLVGPCPFSRGSHIQDSWRSSFKGHSIGGTHEERRKAPVSETCPECGCPLGQRDLPAAR